MTKNDEREFDIARKLVANGRLDKAARTLATLHRCGSVGTRGTVIALVHELGLKDRVTFVESPFYVVCGMVHVDDAPLLMRPTTGERT